MLEMDPSFQRIRLARSIARATFEYDGLDKKMVDSLVLVTSELFTNAIEAGTVARPISVVFTSEPGEAEVRVSNFGPAVELAVERETRDADINPRGRGLAIADNIGNVKIRHRSQRTTVSVRVATSSESWLCSN